MKLILSIYEVFRLLVLSMLIHEIGGQFFLGLLPQPEESSEDEALECTRGSCKTQCGRTHRQFIGNCFCDPDCLLYHDCCHDYGFYCINGQGDHGTNDSREPFEISMNRISRESKRLIADNVSLECATVPNIEGFSTYYMKTKCKEPLQSFLHRNNCENSLQTFNDDPIDLTLITPVLYNNILYRNLYCLQCNEENIVQSNAQFALPSYVCTNKTATMEAREIFLLQSYSQFRNYLRDNCRAYIDMRDMRVPERHRRCYLTEIGNCNSTYDYPAFYEDYCKAFYSPAVSFSNDSTDLFLFRNKYCALCNGKENLNCSKSLLDLFGTIPGLGSRFPSFTLLMDFAGPKSGELHIDDNKYCTAEQYLDVKEEECVPYTCPGGNFLVDDTCVSLNISLNSPRVKISNSVTGHIVVKYNLYHMKVNETTAFVEGVSEEMLKMFYWWWSDYELHLHFPCSYKDHLEGSNSTTKSQERGNEVCVLLVVEMGHRKNPIAELDRQEWSTNMKNILESHADHIQSISAHQLNFNPFDLDSLHCNFGEPFLSHDIIFYKEEFNNLYATHTKENKTGLSQLYKNTPMALVVILEQDTKIQFDYFGIFCRPKIFSCRRTLISGPALNSGLEQIWNFHSSGLMIGNQLIAIGEFAIISEDMLLLCRETYDSLISGKYVSKENVHDLVILILTLVGNVISPLCMLFTIITFCIFKFLRTVPGVCIMNLCISLSSAQVLFQLNQIFVEWDIICLIASAIQHYMWLVSFMWMNVLAYITCETFTNNMVVQDKSAKRLWYYMFYAWCLPVLFVASCVMIDSMTDLDFSYRNKEQCWIIGNAWLIYTFAVPLAMVILSNCVLFAITLTAIKRTMDVAKEANEKSHDRKRFAIYVKLSSVMGFTWLFGFLANLSGASVVFWYLFTFLNTMQGAFICFSFVCTKRVFRGYKALLTRETSEPPSNGSKATVSSTVNSTKGF